MPTTQILTVHRNRIVRDGLVAAISAAEGIQARGVGTNGDPDALVESVQRLQCHIVVLDLGYPERPGLAAVRGLHAAGVLVGALVIGVPDDEAEIMECIEAGAAGYQTLDASLSDLIANIRALANGQTICSPSVASRLFSRVANGRTRRHEPTIPSAPHLTPREKEIVALIEDGRSNKEIARELDICTQTVKNHVHNVLEKLHLGRRAEAARYARRCGLIGAGPKV